MYEDPLDDDEQDLEPPFCPDCDGTGEGPYDGASCASCAGTGEYHGAIIPE